MDWSDVAGTDGFVGTILGWFGEVGVDGLDGFVGTVLG